MKYATIKKIIDEKSEFLLKHKCSSIDKKNLHAPNPKHINDIFSKSDRSPKVIANISRLHTTGRLGGSGYLSVLPVDQGVEHSAGSVFSKNPIYFDPENIIRLAIEGGCNGIASTIGTLGIMSKKYADKIPFIVKLNHNELLSFPNTHNQIFFASVKQAYNLGAVGIGATIYFGSPESRRQIQEVGQAFYEAHQLGMFTMLWSYVRNKDFFVGKNDYNTATDITGQANYLAATIQADIIKQKLPTCNRGFKNLGFCHYTDEMYEKLSSEHPIDQCRYQVANCYMGRIEMISSGGESSENDLVEAIESAIINKRAGGAGMIMGRKAFQKSFEDGIEILNAVQDVYLCKEIDLA